MKKIPSARIKDRVLEMYYQRDVSGGNGKQKVPDNIREIEYILRNDGLITPNMGVLRITEKGCAYRNNGGYSRERRERLFGVLWQHGASISGAAAGALTSALVSWLLH